MVNCINGTNKKFRLLNEGNSKKKLSILDDTHILEKVHILPVRKNIENSFSLYRELNSFIDKKCVLYKGFTINLSNERSVEQKESNTKKVGADGDSLKQLKRIKKEEVEAEAETETDVEAKADVEMESKNESNEEAKADVEMESKNESNEEAITKKITEETAEVEVEECASSKDCQYVIVDCVPSKGILTQDTLIYTDGKYVDNFKRIHILILNDKNYKTFEKAIKNQLFSLKKYFQKKTCEFFNSAISFIPYSLDCFPTKWNRDSSHLKKEEEKKKKKENRKKAILKTILNSYLNPYFQKNKNKLFYRGKVFIINNFTFIVLEVDSNVSVGFIDSQTEILLSVDLFEQFSNVHIVPLYDTLPTAYSYDLFKDYIKPYIERHYLNVYSIYDTFFYNGVQFKIMGVDPKNIKYGKARISCNTYIYTDGSIKPTFFDVISKEAYTYIECFPIEYKPYAILKVLQEIDTDALLRLFPSVNLNVLDNNAKEQTLLKQLSKQKYIFNKYSYSENNTLLKNETSQVENLTENKSKEIIAGNNESVNNSVYERTKDKNLSILKIDLVEEQCAVCFENFQHLDKCIKLKCLHTYHWKCVKNWFRFNLTCPCCRSKLKF